MARKEIAGYGIEVRWRRWDRFVAEIRQSTAAVFCVTRRFKTVKATRRVCGLCSFECVRAAGLAATIHMYLVGEEARERSWVGRSTRCASPGAA
ncbi:hypothetical protein MAPG_02478 [Magnaporthiopsis poae ATCC 64411]|uniref:Uncharacterized protein n=1 Tax=Magnaporthiopsis poae (strain ATCC 64411 / 73-15) TaxID=644358 RepID=A0A0C4DRH0_MAGP6|nr:hypothetical protein MAPG_02478 [Magnaporthiopsis poae ATCC 64411]